MAESREPRAELKHRWLCIPLITAVCAASCGEPTAPPGPPYIAVVSRLSLSPGLSFTGPMRFTVEELSGTLNFNRTLTGMPGDTLVLSVPIASFLVSLHDLPPTCSVLNGPRRMVTLLDSDNTATLRYNVNCVPSLVVEVLMDGYDLDTEIVYRVVGVGGERIGLLNLSGADTMNTRSASVPLDDLPGGEYDVSLSHISGNCSVMGDGQSRRLLDVPVTGGASVAFRLRCSEADKQPHILMMASSYHDQASAFVLRVHDPDRDVRSYSWDLTDCKGNSVLPDRTPRVRRGLDAGRTYRADTLVIVGAFEAGIADTLMRGNCVAIRIEDFRGNLSEYVEQPAVASHAGTAPLATIFNAKLSGTTAILTTLEASDPDGDFAGTFVALRVRDGVLSPFDGTEDIGILDPVGFLGTTIPRIALGTRLRWDDVYAMIVYLIDFSGNFRRLADANLNQ